MIPKRENAPKPTMVVKKAFFPNQNDKIVSLSKNYITKIDNHTKDPNCSQRTGNISHDNFATLF